MDIFDWGNDLSPVRPRSFTGTNVDLSFSSGAQTSEILMQTIHEIALKNVLYTEYWAL